MNDDPAIIARAQRWKLFYEEEGGLRDIIQGLQSAYIARMSDVEPWETGKLSKLAIANKVCQQIEAHVATIFADGQMAQSARDHIKRIEQIPEAKRRWADALGIGNR